MAKEMTPAQFISKLKRLLTQFRDDNMFWFTIGKIARDQRKKEIYGKKDYTGASFVKLKKETIARKRAQGAGDPLKPLVGLTRKLMDADIEVGGGTAKLILDKKVAYHSAETRAKGVPLRPCDKLSEEIKDKVTVFFERRLQRFITNAFGK